jgi:hypothetical protein
MAGFRSYRRVGALGVALTAWDIWRRIPPQHRKTIIKLTRKHGPPLAARIVHGSRRRRAS